MNEETTMSNAEKIQKILKFMEMNNYSKSAIGEFMSLDEEIQASFLETIIRNPKISETAFVLLMEID